MGSATTRRSAIRAATLVLLLLLPSGLLAQSARTDDLRRQAQAFEQRSEWVQACRLYDEAFRKDRTRTDCREGYQRCLRHFHLERRHQDPGYRDILAKLTPDQALNVYKEILELVPRFYVDRDKTDLALLFQQGLNELRFALDDGHFRKAHFAAIEPELLRAFKVRLDDWKDRKVTTVSEAREEVIAVVRAAQEMGLGVRANLQIVLALEFACGACNSLDEYSLFLTPGHYADVQAMLNGKTIGIGIEVNGRGDIDKVYPRSPADEKGLIAGDKIVKIDGKRVEELSPAALAERLRGEVGTTVVLDVEGPMMNRAGLELVRQPLVVPSVDYRLYEVPEMSGAILGYMRIYSFQESTLQEVKEALAQLHTNNVKGLVVDLRGNPGGLFKSAVQVSELFLGTGAVVHTQSQGKSRTFPEKKSDIINPVLLPLAVLIDGDTASSAEVLAGALKEQYQSAIRLLGQTTYGKGSMQSTIRLKKSSGGIRITVAQLFSPTHQPYADRGVSPHVVIAVEGKAGIEAACAALAELVRMMRQ